MSTSQEAQIESSVWLRDLRHRMLNILLGVAAGAGTLGVLYVGSISIARGSFGSDFVWYSVAYLVALVLLFVRRIPDQWRAIGFLAALYGFACVAFYLGWLASGGRQFLMAVMVGAAVLVGPRAGFIAAGLSLLTYVFFGAAFNQGWLTLRPLASPISLPPMIVEGVGFTLAVGVTTTGLAFFRRALQAATRATQEARDAQKLLVERAEQLDTVNQLLAERRRSAEVARQEAEAARQELEIKIWQTTGQAELSESMRGEQDILTLSANVIE